MTAKRCDSLVSDHKVTRASPARRQHASPVRRKRTFSARESIGLRINPETAPFFDMQFTHASTRNMWTDSTLLL
jgi:hypothetical protein